MRIWVTIGTTGGVVDQVVATAHEEQAPKDLAEMDKLFDIVRDEDGHYESDDDVVQRELEIEDD